MSNKITKQKKFNPPRKFQKLEIRDDDIEPDECETPVESKKQDFTEISSSDEDLGSDNEAHEMVEILRHHIRKCEETISYLRDEISSLCRELRIAKDQIILNQNTLELLKKSTPNYEEITNQQAIRNMVYKVPDIE